MNIYYWVAICKGKVATALFGGRFGLASDAKSFAQMPKWSGGHGTRLLVEIVVAVITKDAAPCKTECCVDSDRRSIPNRRGSTTMQSVTGTVGEM